VERIVLVHGSVTGGRVTWTPLRAALRHRLDLVVLERPGFPPNPPVDRVDFDEHAALVGSELGGGSHLVGHSYGGVIALLAAAGRPGSVRSLTVIEPPCTQVAAGDPAAERFEEEGRRWWRDGPVHDPEAFVRGFLRYVGSDFDPPSPLAPQLEQGAQTLLFERGPWDAKIPLAEIAAAPFPLLAVSGGHHPAFEAICDALAREAGAERLVLPGYGHAPHRHPGFAEALAGFVDRAAAGAGSDRRV
jgi:pimeloyl-ACP methyl ester carboxylesterase